MTLPVSGTIDFYAVNIEIGNSGTAQISFDDANVRTLAGVPSGTIGFTNLHGKSWFTLTATTPGVALVSEGVTNGGTIHAYIQPTSAAFMGSQYNSSGSDPAFGSPTGGTIAAGSHFKYTVNSGTVGHTNMTAGVWYPVGSGYYVGTKRTNTNGTTACNLSVSFAKDSSGTGATTAGTHTMTCTIAPA